MGRKGRTKATSEESIVEAAVEWWTWESALMGNPKTAVPDWCYAGGTGRRLRGLALRVANLLKERGES